MKTRVSSMCESRRLGLLLVLTAMGAISLAGCEKTLEPGETYHKVSVGFPIFDVDRSEGVEADGTQWEKVKGDAAVLLYTWDFNRKYCKQEMVYRKERKTFIPFYSVNVEETPEYKKTWGMILLFPYSSNQLKGPEAQVPPLNYK